MKGTRSVRELRRPSGLLRCLEGCHVCIYNQVSANALYEKGNKKEEKKQKSMMDDGAAGNLLGGLS
jgi:hypothetical protein